MQKKWTKTGAAKGRMKDVAANDGIGSMQKKNEKKCRHRSFKNERNDER